MARELGRLVEQQRTELGMSRRDLAERSGLSYPYVSQIETGEREPALKAMRALATALDLPVERLASVTGADAWVSGPPPAFAALAARDSAPPPLSSRPSPAPTSSSRRSSPSPSSSPEKLLHSVERKLADLPPLDRLAVLHELTARALAELRAEQEQ